MGCKYNKDMKSKYMDATYKQVEGVMKEVKQTPIKKNKKMY